MIKSRNLSVVMFARFVTDNIKRCVFLKECGIVRKFSYEFPTSFLQISYKFPLYFPGRCAIMVAWRDEKSDAILLNERGLKSDNSPRFFIFAKGAYFYDGKTTEICGRILD